MIHYLFSKLTWIIIIFVGSISTLILVFVSNRVEYANYSYQSIINHNKTFPTRKYDDININLNRWWNLDDTELKPDCQKYFRGNISNTDLEWSPMLPADDMFLHFSCKQIRDYWSFPERPRSSVEEQFPIAYVFLGQKNIFQTLSLFRTIYWPQNLYCINWDSKSSLNYQKLLTKLVSCFHNVITVPRHRNIYWGDYSLLQATMDCVEVLIKFKSVQWKYMEIVSWNDYPLKTNYEMVKIFSTFNGANDVSMGMANMGFILGHDPKKSKDKFHVPPSNLILYKGSFAVALSRSFVDFVTSNPEAQKFYKWLNGTWCAEEHFWSTLNHNLHLSPPGGYPGACLSFHIQKKTRKPFVTRYQLWPHVSGRKCKGKMVHKSCLLGIEDLPELVLSRHLWAHKVYQDFQPGTLYCLHEFFFDKIKNAKEELLSDQFNYYYSNLAHVKFHNMKNKEKFSC